MRMLSRGGRARGARDVKINRFALGTRFGVLIASIESAQSALASARGQMDLLPEDERQALRNAYEVIHGLWQRSLSRFEQERKRRG